MSDKESLKVIQKALTNLTGISRDLDDHIDKVTSDIDNVIKDIEILKDSLQEKFDEMSETAQDGDEGQELASFIEELESALEYATNLKEELETDRFVELIEHLESIKE